MAGKLIDLFQNCKLLAEEQHLASGEVRSLAFGDNNTVMVVELDLKQVVSRKTLAKAEKQIAKQYGLSRVCIEPHYTMSDGLTAEYIHSLYEDMAFRMPSARGLLDCGQVALCGRRAANPDGRGSASAILQMRCVIWKRVFCASWAHPVRCMPCGRKSATSYRHLTRRRVKRFCKKPLSRRLWKHPLSRNRKSRVPHRNKSTPAISARARKRCARMI